MEEEKAAAYYDELTRKGSGAARFKQGLGFSATSTNSNDVAPARGSALPTTSSTFLSSFVKASSPTKSAQLEKESQLQSIHNKLSSKPPQKPKISSTSDPFTRTSSRQSRSPSPDRYKGRKSRRKTPSPSPDRNDRRSSRSRNRESRHRSRSPDRESRRRSRSRDTESRRRRRSRSRDSKLRRRSWSRDREDRSRSRSRDRELRRSKERSRRRSRSDSPRRVKSEKGRSSGGCKVDYARIIEGYDRMTPAERVKAKVKLQLSETAKRDETLGSGSGWERFDFDKDAPLDDEEIEAADDDAVLVKYMAQSFRFSAHETKKEEAIKVAHDEAMFGASSLPPPTESDDEPAEHNSRKDDSQSAPVTNLLSAKVLTMQQGSWRDRGHKG